MRTLTLGSLFDGIGGFPFAASLFGIEPVWASEILPEAVAVTRRHFPNMLHVSDITKLSGELLPPVDIICFGSPCQDLSQANNNRRGLEGSRSGLFTEAIRIIKEMRCSTNGQYPRYALWENVPGAFNSGRPPRSDFRAVIEAFANAEIPMPESNRWANAGMVRGDTSDFAWAVYNAADFGLAQRRRRIFALADFGGTSAGEILLVPKSLPWHPAASRKAEQEAAGSSQQGVNCTGGIGINGEKAGTLDASYYKGTGMRGNIEREVVLCAATDQSHAGIMCNVAPTLNCGCEKPFIASANPVCVLNDQGGSSLNVEQGGHSPTLRHATHGNLPIVVHPPRSGTLVASGAGMSRPAGNANEIDLAVAIDCRNFRENPQSGTLQSKSTGGYSLNYQNPIREDFVLRRLTPRECERLMGFPDDWTAFGTDGEPISDSKRYCLLGNSVATSCVAYIMQGIKNHLESEAKTNGG